MRNASFVTALILLVLTGAVSSLLAYRPVPVVVATNLEKLPMEIDGYHAVEDTFPESVYKELNADKNIYRHYRAADGSVLDLYIGYYGTAKGGRTGHNPYACLPGAGAAIVDTGTVYVMQSINKRKVKVNYVLAKKDSDYLVMLHWYQTAGSKVVANGWEQNLERLIRRTFYNRNDGGFVRISADVTDIKVMEAKQRALVFAEKVMNLLEYYWPEEM